MITQEEAEEDLRENELIIKFNIYDKRRRIKNINRNGI
jgi:hypothetical protein